MDPDNKGQYIKKYKNINQEDSNSCHSLGIDAEVTVPTVPTQCPLDVDPPQQVPLGALEKDNDHNWLPPPPIPTSSLARKNGHKPRGDGVTAFPSLRPNAPPETDWAEGSLNPSPPPNPGPEDVAHALTPPTTPTTSRDLNLMPNTCRPIPTNGPGVQTNSPGNLDPPTRSNI